MTLILSQWNRKVGAHPSSTRTVGASRLASSLASALALAIAGCAVHTQHDFVFLGPWSRGRQEACGDGECIYGPVHFGPCRSAKCEPPRVGPPDAVLQDGDQVDESYIPPGAAAHSPPPSVHTRFHPVPTRPIFSKPTPPAAPQTSPMIESLPREYNSTPRLRSVPRPHLDPEELQEKKQEAEDADREEKTPLPRDFNP